MVDKEIIIAKSFITYVETVNNLLKVWFQRDEQACLAVESHLNDLKEDLQFGPYSVRKYDDLSPGLICFGKFEDGKYYRIKILDVTNCGANVFFIDFGNETILDISDIRVINQNDNDQIISLINVTPLASSAFLNNVVLLKPLSDEQLTNLRQNLMYTYRTCSLKFFSLNLFFIDIQIDKRYLSEIIIDSRLGTSITDAELISRIQSMMNPMYQTDSQKMTGRSLVSHRLQVRNKTTQPKELTTPKVTFHSEERHTSSTPNTLPIGSTYNAYITHVEDGPFSFTVQLKSYSEEIQPNIDSMCKINPPRLNNIPLLPGSNILGRSRADSKFKRAVVMNVKSNSCKVYYMDYGTTEELPQSEIYILPDAIRDLAQPQAMGFCLANLQSVSLPESCKEVFAKLVLNKQVLLRVTQNEQASLTQCCEMFLDGKNVRDVLLNITLPLEYTSQSPPRGREVEVNVSFVDCPSQFFVQYLSEVHILGIIQEALAEFCPAQERLQSMSQISIGKPVASLYNFDNLWYRALVIGIEDDSVNVLYVDYGNRDNVRVDQLCYISRELVTKWRTQAVECCLIGYENATTDPILAQEMENLVLGGQFTLKLQSLLGGSRFVGDLIDKNGQSVVKIMNDLAKSLNQSSSVTSPGFSRQDAGKQTPSKFPQSSPHVSQSYSTEVDHKRGNIGDSGGDGRNDRFGGGGGRRNTTDTRSHPERSYNKYSEHDDRNIEHYEDNRGGDRYKKKWEDRNGAERSNWRDEGRRDDSRRNDDTGERGHRFSGGSGADRSERGNRFSTGSNERGGRYNDGRGGERKERFGGGDGGGRFSGNREEDFDKNSDHSSTGDKFGGGGVGVGGGARYSDRGSNRGADRSSGGVGGGRKFGGDHDNKFGGERKFGGDRGDRKFGGDRGDKFGGDRGDRKFSGDRGDKFGGRPRDQGDNRSGGGGRRNNEKRSFDNSSKSRDHQNQTCTSIAESTDDWEVDKAPKISTTVSAPVVREYPTLNIVAGESYNVYFCEMGNDPNDVYVQMDGSNELLDELRAQIDLEEAALISNGNRAVAKELLTPGLPVLARFADDNLLYRAVVRSHINETVTVLFVDYGNYGQVSLSDLYTVTPALASKPIQALRIMLNDIKPVSASEKWETDHTKFLPYYDADNVLKLKVDVLKSIDGEIVCIGSLTRTDGKTVSAKLVEDGLAKSTNEALSKTQPKQENAEDKKSSPSEWDNKLDYLVRQTLYAKVTKVINSNSLMLNICSLNKNIECQLDDDRTLSNIPTGSDVIISVSGVEDKRLLITLYDQQGKQLGESASGSAPSSICPICPMPVVKETIPVYISYFNNQTIFIQKSSLSDEIAVFLDKLFERYSTSEVDKTKEWKTGMLCCTLSEDGNWYRARIIETVNEKYTVLFIDYGNTEIVEKQQLREIDSEFLKLPEYSLGVHLPVEWLVKEPPFMKYVENEEFNCTFLKNTFGIWIVDLKYKTSGEKLVKKLVEESIAKEKEITEDKTVSMNSSFTVGSSVPVIVSHVDTPTMFWVHLCKDVNTIDELQQKLQDCVERMPKENSKVFAAQYSEDGMWYRAVSCGEGDTVRFIDYGNTDSAPLRKELPADLLNPVEGYAVLMYLCVKPIADNWSAEAIKMFEAFIEHAITAEIKSVDEKIIVDLKSNDQYLSKLLIEGNHAKYIDEEENTAPLDQIEYPTLYDVVILTIRDVNSFYVQLLTDQENQLEMIYNLDSADKFEHINELILGDLIAAKSVIDEQWYRGLVTSVDPPQTFFIDYGFILNISDYRKLPNSLKTLPPMAIHCSLDLENHKSLTEQFAIMTNDASRVYRLMYKRKGDPNIVDLQLEDGCGISEFLTAIGGPYIMAETDMTVKEENKSTKIVENCIVCHANGPYDFYIHTPSSQGLAEDIIEKMADASSFPKIEKLEKGDIVASVSNDDESWYRCKIIDLEPEISGCFIDYGNSSFVSEYRSLPEELKSIEPLAIKCSLQLPDGIGGWSAEAVLSFTELVNENMSGFNVIVISEGDPWVVELVVNDHNKTKVTEELLKLCPAATPVQSKPATRATTPVASDLEPTRSDKNEQQFQTPPCSPLSGRCYVTHVNSPTDFFVRDTNTSSNLEKVALALAELESNPKPEPHNIDDLVVAQVDGEYFRAKIMEVNPIKVSLIDVGNTSETSDLVQVPDSIKNIPPTVRNCSLHVSDEHKIILNNKKAEEEFMTITASNVEFTYKMLTEGDRPEIELSLNGENIVHLLSEHLNINETPSITSESKQAKHEPLKLNTPIKVTVPYVISLREFYIQEITPENDLLAEKLNQADIFNSCKSLNIGDLVAACSLEDCLWYRAEIIDTNPIEVFFVDFGNISVVEEVRELPEEISKIPYRSVLAELVRPEGVKEWSQKADEKFASICDSTFDCIIIADNGIDKPCTVQLSTATLGDLSKALLSDDKEEPLSTNNEPENINTSDSSNPVTAKDFYSDANEEFKTDDKKEDGDTQNGSEEDYYITQEIIDPNSIDLTDQTIVETEEDADISFNKSDTNSTISASDKKDETPKKLRTPLKVKSVAEIKATAKPKIVTRSLSATPLKTGRSTPSPVHKPSKTSVDDKSKSPEKSGSPLKRSVSFEDKIIPGCVSGNVEK